MEYLIIPALVFLLIFMSIVSVQQGTIVVITMFGKFQRILTPGLNFKLPIIVALAATAAGLNGIVILLPF